MNLYYIKVSKIVSDIIKVDANTEEDAIDKIKKAIDNSELCMLFFNNTEYVFDIIDDIDNKNITSI